MPHAYNFVEFRPQMTGSVNQLSQKNMQSQRNDVQCLAYFELGHQQADKVDEEDVEPKTAVAWYCADLAAVVYVMTTPVVEMEEVQRHPLVPHQEPSSLLPPPSPPPHIYL